MDLRPVEAVLETGDAEAISTLLDDEALVFWIDWRQPDETIADSCEEVMRTGRLSGELIEVDTEDGYEVHMRYEDRRIKVPLTYTAGDRHITICTLNELLAPEHEIRFCIDSNESDTLAFLPLSTAQWAGLERQYGDALACRFYRIMLSPNLFTDVLQF